MWRHDAARTALQDLGGELRHPTVLWTLPMGGGLPSTHFLVADVNLDTRREVVAIRGGRVVVRQDDGRTVWIGDALGANRLVGVADLDRNGRPEIVATSLVLGLVVLDGTTGRLLWRSPAGSGPVGTALLVDVDQDGSEEVYVADRGCSLGGLGTGRVFSFGDSFAGSTQRATLQTEEHGYWCGVSQAVADVDGDGLLEVVTLSDDRVVAYDLQTGQVDAESESLGRFPFGLGVTTVADIDGSGVPEIIVATDNAATPDGRRLAVIRWSAGSLIEIARLTLPESGQHRFLRRPVCNFGFDGGVSVVTSAFEQGGWHVSVLVLSPGDVLEEVLRLDGVVAIECLDVNGDGRDELLARNVPTSAIPTFGTVRLVAMNETQPSEWVEMWRIERASVPMSSGAWESGAHAVLMGDPANGVLLLRDDDMDERSEEAVVIGLEGQIVTRRRLGGAAHAVAVSRQGPRLAPLALSRADGAVELLDEQLVLRNDTVAPYGQADVMEMSFFARDVAVTTEVTGALLLTATPGGSPGVFALAAADAARPPEAVWQTARPAASSRSVAFNLRYGERSTVSLVGRRPDLSLGLDVLNLDGEVIASHQLPRSAGDRVLWDVLPVVGTTGDLESSVVGTFDQQDGTIDYWFVPTDGPVSHLSVLARSNFNPTEGALSAHDFVGAGAGDGRDDVYLVQGRVARAVDPRTGTELASNPVGVTGLLSFVDLDCGGEVAVLHTGSSVSPARLRSDLSLVWTAEDVERRRQFGAAVCHQGVSRVAAVTANGAVMHVYSGDDGRLVTSLALGQGMSFASVQESGLEESLFGSLTDVIAVRDLLGDGTASFVVGSTDGHLYAVRAEDGALQWSMDLRAALSSPIAADIDSDGLTEIVVGAADGKIYAIDQARVTGPGYVYDTDGTYTAASPEEDLDVLGTATSVGANWEEVAGAVAYQYQIIQEGGAVVLPWANADTASFERSDVVFQLGRRYMTAVRALVPSSDGRILVSTEARSDGFEVRDQTAPSVVVRTEPEVFEAPGESTLIEFELRDAVGLRSYSVAIEDPDGRHVRELGEGQVGGMMYVSTGVWGGMDDEGSVVPTGSYRVVVRAVDLARNEAQGTSTVVVCSRGSSSILPCGETADAGPRDADGPASWEVRGGCSCSIGGSGLQRRGDTPFSVLPPTVWVLLWIRRRAVMRSARY